MDNYFSKEELACKHCLEAGKSIEEAYVFDDEFLELLNHLRVNCGFALPVSSGYRCPNHPIEAAKGTTTGAHCSGKAVDIAISGARAHKLVKVALALGIPRIGVAQRGNNRFIHLDYDGSLPTPRIWSY